MIRLAKPIFLLTFFAMLAQALFLFGFEKMDEMMAIPLILILGGTTAYFLGKSRYEDAEFQVSIFLLAFSIRALVGMIFYGWGLYKALGDEDATGYMSGWSVASNWYTNGLDGFISDILRVFLDKQNVGQSIIWGIPMFIAGGPSRMIVSVVNGFAGALLVIVIYRIARCLFDQSTARIAAIIVTFWASIILLSAGTSKEMLVILFEWSLLYFAIRNPAGLTINDGIASIPAFLALYLTRFYALYMVIVAFAFRVLLSSKKNLVRNALLGTIVLGSVMALLLSSGVVDRDFERLDHQTQIMDAWRKNVATSTGSGTLVYSEYDNSAVAIPVATVYFFFAPFPWELFGGSLRSSFAAVENVLIIILLILGIPALRIFFRSKLVEVAPILIFCVMYAGFQIWGMSNVGLAWRHKQTVMPIVFMLVALSIAKRKQGWGALSDRVSRKRKEVNLFPGVPIS